MTDSLVITPANYVPVEALAFGSLGGAATPVGPENPLPVRDTMIATASTALAGTAGSSTVVGPFVPELGRPIHLTLSGTWAGNVTVKRSIDGGTTKLPLTVGGDPWGVFVANCNEPVWEEGEAGATFYLDFSRTSGTLTYRVAQ